MNTLHGHGGDGGNGGRHRCHKNFQCGNQSIGNPHEASDGFVARKTFNALYLSCVMPTVGLVELHLLLNNGGGGQYCFGLLLTVVYKATTTFLKREAPCSQNTLLVILLPWPFSGGSRKSLTTSARLDSLVSDETDCCPSRNPPCPLIDNIDKESKTR